ncbi:hypothetical protein F5Y18DRAFT_226888 [Xylariaceae sp. FL1019]|nr:hypothetical protein F5Y18DRAFT_226888 [Xylariaceae sp. FL1019]
MCIGAKRREVGCTEGGRTHSQKPVPTSICFFHHRFSKTPIGMWLPFELRATRATRATKYHDIRLSEEKSHFHDNEDDDTRSTKPVPRQSWKTFILASIIVGLTTCLITISTMYLRLLSGHEAPRSRLTCGHSIKEAQEAGCSFDHLTKSWLNPGCPRPYDDEFVDYPLTLNMSSGWRYWTDTRQIQEITDEDMALSADKPQNETRWVSTARMHLAHCAFGLLRRVDAHHAGARLDYATIHLDHAKHCIRLLLESAMMAPNIDEPVAEGTAILGAC